MNLTTQTTGQGKKKVLPPIKEVVYIQDYVLILLCRKVYLKFQQTHAFNRNGLLRKVWDKEGCLYIVGAIPTIDINNVVHSGIIHNLIGPVN